MKKLFFTTLFLMSIAICNGCGNNSDSAIVVDTLNVAELQKQAESDNADAQAELGRLYYYGERGIKKDYAKAIELFQKAVDKGNVYGKYWLGICYDEGNGVDANFTKANTLYKEAFTEFSKMAEIGDAKALCYLGLCYLHGLGTEKNKELSIAAYKKSAEQGYAVAQNNLGAYYETTQSYTEAVKWYRLAAEQGYAVAQNNLGSCYDLGYGVTQSYTEAVKWYRLAAEQGEASAQCSLGYSYENGYGVTQSYTEAIKWYRLAVEQGNAHAQFCLGACNLKTNNSYKETVKLWHLAAEQGYAPAQYSLALCYASGKGVKQSNPEAIKWLKKAAKQGLKEAILILTKIGINDYN